MKPAIITAAFIAVLLLIVGVVLPLFIGWEGHAAKLSSYIKETTGYEVSYKSAGGSILPMPELELHDFVVGDTATPLLKSPLAKVKFGFGGVFSSSATPDEIELLVAEVHIADDNALKNAAKMPVSIVMEQAKLFYGNNPNPELENVSLGVYPQNSGGSVTVGWDIDGNKVKLSASWDNWPYDATSHIKAGLDDGISKCSLDGELSPDENKNLSGKGHFDCQTTGWGKSLSNVMPSWRDYGTEQFMPAALSASGDFEISNGNMAVKKFSVIAGEDKFNADIVIGGESSAIGIEAESIAIDQYIESGEKFVAAMKARKIKLAENSPEKKLGIFDESILPDDLKLSVHTKANRMQWRGQWVEGFAAEAMLGNGIWNVDNASGTLPGGGKFSLNGQLSAYDNKPIFNGKLKADGDNMKLVLDLLKAPLPAMPEGVLGKFTIDTGFALSPEFWRLTETNLNFDDVRSRGAMIVKFPPPKKVDADLALPDLRPEQERAKERKLAEKAKKDGKEPPPPAQQLIPVQPAPEIVSQPLQVELSLAADKLDIDKYLPPESFMPNAGDAVGHMSKRLDWLKNLGGNANIAVALSNSRFRGFDISEFHGNAKLMAGRFEMESFRATLADKELSGNFTLTPGSLVPGFDLTFYSGAMKSEEIMSFIYAKPYTMPEKSAAPAEYKWPEDPIELPILNISNGNLDLNMDALTFDGTTYGDFRIRGRLQDSVLDIEQASARLSQGEMAIRGRVNGGNLPQIEGSFIIAGVDIDKLLGIRLDIKSITGKTRVAGSIKTSGVSQRTMVSNLNGNGTITIDDLNIDGFDLNTISRRSLAARTVDDVAALGQMSLEEGSSRVKKLEAHFAFKDGLLQLPVTSLETEYTSGGLQMTVDMLRFLMNMKLSFKPRTVTDGTVPMLHFIAQGAVESPQKKLDIADLEAYIAKRAVGQ